MPSRMVVAVALSLFLHLSSGGMLANAEERWEPLWKFDTHG